MNRNDWTDMVKTLVWATITVLITFAFFTIFRSDDVKEVEASDSNVVTRIVAPADADDADECVHILRQKLEAVESVVEPLEAPVETPSETEEVTVVVENIRVTSANVEYYDVPLDRELQSYIFAVCADYDVDPSLIFAMIECESSYRIDVVGDNGKAFGLMQIQPRWHSDRMSRLGVTDLLDPYQNVTVGIDYLAELISWNRGVDWALMAYNGGPGRANERHYAVVRYLEEVMNTQKKLDICE